MQARFAALAAIAAICVFVHGPAVFAAEFQIDQFKTIQLDETYYSEGAGAGDFNNDGHVDVVYGPYWYAGPDFQQKHEIYPPKPQDVNRYADNFFSWVYDFNGDGFNDVFVVGFPGTPAYVYENPTADKLATHWKKHQVFDWVSNESPHFTDIVGDERPELVCTREGLFGYATIDWEQPFAAWTFHPISEKIAAERFGHGLGVGDVNGDERQDVIMTNGWFEQPESLEGAGRWKLHPAKFTNAYGGAEMYAYDVDGDGDNDIITSLAAHEFGLAWYEQTKEGDEIAFREHLIMGARPDQNRYGLVFSELHSVNLADIDGDGLKDIVTGKTYWSHHRQSPMWDAGAVVYWFRLVRNADGVDWIPYKAGEQSGIGRQLGVHDVNGDGLLDFVVGGMKGAHVLIHSRETVDEATWKAQQPEPFRAASSTIERGKPAPIDEKTGRVAGAIEGESLKATSATAGEARSQKMANFKADRWSGGEQLFWTGAKPGDRLVLELPVAEAGKYQLEAVFTMARDYGIVQVLLDDKPLGEPRDLYNYPDVVTTGLVDLGEHELSAGNHQLALEITGANPSAAKAYMAGIDFVRLVSK